jgi:hypothetical protein
MAGQQAVPAAQQDACASAAASVQCSAAGGWVGLWVGGVIVHGLWMGRVEHMCVASDADAAKWQLQQ